MESRTIAKIEETYKIALKLGLHDNATEMELKIFKDMLFRIATSAVDESRTEINELLHNKALSFENPE